ncbi:MAG: LytTR family DNA-binding domain-containing protein [Bacteroidia bacterium]
MINCIVIEDELQHREYLRDIIEKNFPDVKLAAEAKSVIEGIQLVNNSVFDILFLDVRMPPLSGFDVLKSVTRRDFEVVFTTSYDEYALEAIKFSALDFLLKPYSVDDLKTTFEKFRNKENHLHTAPKIDNLLHNINPVNQKKRIGLSDKNGIEFYEIDDIVYCKSDNAYTTVFFDNKKQVVTSKPIRDYEKELSNFPFYRIHNSYLINLNKVKKYIRGDGGQVILTDGTTLDVARNKKEGFLHRLNEV